MKFYAEILCVHKTNSYFCGVVTFAHRQRREDDSGSEHLLRERGHIERSMTSVEDVIGQATAAKNSLRSGARVFEAAQGKMNRINSKSWMNCVVYVCRSKHACMPYFQKYLAKQE